MTGDERMAVGRQQFIDAEGGGNENLALRLIEKMGIYSLTWFIEQVLDEHYPIEVFPSDVLFPTWGGEHGGADIDPGVKWVALLRQAVREVREAPEKPR